MLLTGIAIGVYFTFNICFALLTRYDFFFKEFAPMKWFWWPVSLLFGGVIALGIAIYHYSEMAHTWLDANWWHYRWLNDTLRFHHFLGMVNRMDCRGLTFIILLSPCNWPRRKLIERANERLKELDQ